MMTQGEELRKLQREAKKHGISIRGRNRYQLRKLLKTPKKNQLKSTRKGVTIMSDNWKSFLTIIGGVFIGAILAMTVWQVWVYPLPAEPRAEQSLVSEPSPSSTQAVVYDTAEPVRVVEQDESLSQLATQVAQLATQVAQPAKEEPMIIIATAVATKVATTMANDLEAPFLQHGDSHAPEEGYGSFDIGVHADQVGLVFGWHVRWPKVKMDAGGEGCDLVLLTPGWYENLEILDGRYEVYTVPTSDYDGWVKVLGQQRADEQAANYGCPTKTFEEIPQWESPIPSPP